MIKVLFFSILCTSLLLSKTTNATEKITLEKAKKYAIEQNFQLKSLRLDLAITKTEKDSIIANYLPRFGFVAGLNSYGEIAKEIGPVAYSYFSYNLFNGYRDNTHLQLSKIQIEKQKLALKRKEFIVGLSVEKQFHTYIYYKDLLDLQSSAVKLNEKHKSLVKKTKRAGMSSATDVMEFKLKEAILQSELELLNQQLEEIRTRLKMLLGEELGSSVIPVGAIQHQHIEGSLMSYLKRIKNSSVPVKMASLNLKKSNAEEHLWKASWLPTLDLEARIGQLPVESINEKREPSASFLLTAKLELFSGFQSRFDKRKQQLSIARDENYLKQNILMSITEMETSYRRLKTIEKRVDLEENNVGHSKAYYMSVKQEYLRGYKNSSDLASAAEGFVESQKRKIVFMYSFLMEKIKLEETLGSKVHVKIIH